MHRWISLTTALEAEGSWIVTLTVHDHIQTQPIPISEWRGRGGGEVWVVFVWVGGDKRELVMVFLYCVDLVSFFVYGIVLDVCLFDVDFSGDCVIELFGVCVATYLVNTSKSLHHYYHKQRKKQGQHNTEKPSPFPSYHYPHTQTPPTLHFLLFLSIHWLESVGIECDHEQ